MKFKLLILFALVYPYSAFGQAIESKSFPGVKDVFDATRNPDSGSLSRPSKIMRAKPSMAEMKDLITKIEKVAAGEEVTCDLLIKSKRKIRDEVEAVVNKLHDKGPGDKTSGQFSYTYELLDIKPNREESGICGIILRSTNNASNEVVLVEYDIEENVLEVIGYGQGS